MKLIPQADLDLVISSPCIDLPELRRRAIAEHLQLTPDLASTVNSLLLYSVKAEREFIRIITGTMPMPAQSISITTTTPNPPPTVLTKAVKPKKKKNT